MKRKSKFLLIILSIILTTTVIYSSTNINTANTATISAKGKIYKKYGPNGFKITKTISRKKLNAIATKSTNNKNARNTSASLASVFVTAPLGPYASISSGVATTLIINALPHSSDSLNATLKKSSAKKFKVTAHYRFIRKGADKYYIISHFTAKPA
ncbi:hypothetical protein RSA37_13050 [Mammaliicoccus sciuri]|nr:hypothetical protein [Mammaliicoccus sciuri]KTT84866.1 hypothetical protein NS1R_08140 [Mammaliicoccus sciuri]KTT90658.1 hypothetical protein NS36R_05355 [Mammaliicoccus sciuri]KTT92498.1 hypothetical protein NS44R_14360 [Mammaliicoccus sciuri]KTW10405.1 hypothetical protein RSA37_13050 [Mammaliicoccus sciuri]KTW17737.1 hypothetical protein NS53R_02965 [Mammaliicoccus sciuri]